MSDDGFDADDLISWRRSVDAEPGKSPTASGLSCPVSSGFAPVTPTRCSVEPTPEGSEDVIDLTRADSPQKKEKKRRSSEVLSDLSDCGSDIEVIKQHPKLYVGREDVQDIILQDAMEYAGAHNFAWHNPRIDNKGTSRWRLRLLCSLSRTKATKRKETVVPRVRTGTLPKGCTCKIVLHKCADSSLCRITTVLPFRVKFFVAS